MVQTFRVGAKAFPIADAHGAAISGGRWNSQGVSMLYTADSPITAMLEAGVERSPRIWREALLAEFSIPDALVSRNVAGLLAGDPEECRRIGDDWVASGASCVFQVPSRSVTSARLYLINPRHNDYPRIDYQVSDLMLAPDRPSSTAPQIEVQRWPGLVDRHGQPLRDEPERKARIEIFSLADLLLAEISTRPEQMLWLDPRQFEEVIARFYERHGWEVKLTPASKDGGKDLIIVKQDEAGTRTCFVECKRYAPHRPVGVEIVRQLYGVVQKDNATSGILMTTSRFTRGAVDEQRSIANRLQLHDYQALTRLLGPPRTDDP